MVNGVCGTGNSLPSIPHSSRSSSTFPMLSRMSLPQARHRATYLPTTSIPFLGIGYGLVQKWCTFPRNLPTPWFHSLPQTSTKTHKEAVHSLHVFPPLCGWVQFRKIVINLININFTASIIISYWLLIIIIDKLLICLIIHLFIRTRTNVTHVYKDIPC